jgi:dienelactone hydrolase
MSKSIPSRRALLKGGVATAITAALAGPSTAAEIVPLHGKPLRQIVSFKSGGQTCYGMVHAPGTLYGKPPGVLMIHGLVGSKDQPHRIFVTLADVLAEAGFASLRFDLRGRGDSDGQSIDITPRADLEDARNALDFLRQQPNIDAGNVIVVGMGWGGVLAALTSDNPAVKRIVLWSCAPVDRDAGTVPKMKDYNGRRAADVSGNLVGQPFYDGLSDLEPVSVLKKTRRPVLLVYGTRDEALRQKTYELFTSDMQFAEVNLKAVPITGADHGFTSHEWEQQAIEATVGWLKER